MVGGVVSAVHSLPKHAVAAWAGAPKQSGPPVTIHSVPDRFRITYRIDTGHPLGQARSTEELSVHRPFESRAITRSSTKGHPVVADETTALGRSSVASPGQPAQVLALPADLAGHDIRLDLTLDSLLADGRIVRLERRVVLGRPCQVYRSSGSLDGAALTRPSDGNVTDSCVDGSGLVLAEVQRSGGAVTRRQIATAVDEQPTFGAGFFAVGDSTIPPSQGGASYVKVDPATRPSGRAFVLDTPPAGFTYLGRFVDVSATANSPQGTPTATRRAGFSDVYVRGRDAVIVDQGGVTIGGPPFSTDPFGQPLDLGPVGHGEAIAGTRLQVVRALPTGGGGGDYVRVAGTIPIDQLAAIARSLRVLPPLGVSG